MHPVAPKPQCPTSQHSSPATGSFGLCGGAAAPGCKRSLGLTMVVLPPESADVGASDASPPAEHGCRVGTRPAQSCFHSQREASSQAAGVSSPRPPSSRVLRRGSWSVTRRTEAGHSPASAGNSLRRCLQWAGLIAFPRGCGGPAKPSFTLGQSVAASISVVPQKTCGGSETPGWYAPVNRPGAQS